MLERGVLRRQINQILTKKIKTLEDYLQGKFDVMKANPDPWINFCKYEKSSLAEWQKWSDH